MKPPSSLRPHRRQSGGHRWHEHNSARRTAILDAAVALIEEHRPGADISVQQVAERAGLARSVVYRQFDNREDLDAQVREYIFQRYLADFEQILVLDPARTAEEIILEVMRTVVRWAAEHPNLYQFAQSGPLPGTRASATVASFRQRIADALWQRFASWTRVLGIDVTPFRPLGYGLVGLVESIVTEYLGAPGNSEPPDQDALARVLTSATWHLFDGHARDLGYTFDRTAPVAGALGALFDATAKRPE